MEYKIRTLSDVVDLKEYSDRLWDDYDIEELEIDEWSDNGYSMSDFI